MRRGLVGWILGLELGVAVGTLLFFLIAQRPILLQLLGRALLTASTSDRVLVAWTSSAQTLALLTPALLVGLGCAVLGRRRWALHAFAILGGLTLSYASLDIAIYLGFGRHLAQVLKFLFVPGAVNGAGGSSTWLFAVARTLLLIGFMAYLVSSGALYLCLRLAERASAAFAWTLAILAAVALLVAGVAPRYLTSLYASQPLRAGTQAALLWQAQPFGAAGEHFDAAGWQELARGVRDSYQRQFPRLYAGRVEQIAAGPSARRPSVLVIVVESWRADALSAAQMPRSSAWAERGLRAERHYAGSDYSEAGMFAIFYGRSPLLYHATLDAKEPPALCALAHALGYGCAYYSGQPTTWMRAEEFINARQIERFVHDDRGPWSDWDRHALQAAVSDLNAAGARPLLAVVYLMSTHFEYRYPPEYERHTPVTHDAAWLTTDPAALAAADIQPLKNRYANALAFTDDIVADAIARLDPENTVIALTGDHGEAFGEAGHFSHGNGFGEAVSRVPFALVGPGVPVSRRSEPSTHADLLPTLAHALGARASFARESRDLLAPSAPRPTLLLAHCSFNRDSADVLLAGSVGRLRLELGLRQPDVTLKGMEDSEGRPLGFPALTPSEVETDVNAFDGALGELWRAPE